jgi:hypothetical protein
MYSNLLTNPAAKPQLYAAFQGQKDLKPIHDVNHASRILCTVRDRYSLGGSELPNLIIYSPDKKPIGYVSYNGRVWSGAPTDYPRTELVYDPTENPYGRDRQIQGGAIFEHPSRAI